jgi:CIC family chloride channel protein
LTIILACVIGVLGGFGAVVFTTLINLVTKWTVEPIVSRSEHWAWLAVLWLVPAVGLLLVSWFTRRFAREAQGHGVPEVITAVGRHDGVIRPRVSVVKILASGVCIGAGGSVGREGPIVQIGSSLGSMAGQWSKLPPQNIKVLVAAGAAAGISATFNAPLAGVVFASEIILGSFAVESLAPIVIASVLADVTKARVSEHGWNPAFQDLHYTYQGALGQLPFYVLLGLVCGLAAVLFTKLLYAVEDVGQQRFPKWWMRTLIFGALVGVSGAVYPMSPPKVSDAAGQEIKMHGRPSPPLFGVGYEVVDHALRLENADKPASVGEINEGADKIVQLDAAEMLSQLWWLLPLALLKPLMTSLAAVKK